MYIYCHCLNCENRVLRIIKFLPRRAHTEPIFVYLKLLNLLIRYTIIWFYYLCSNIFVVVYPNCLIINIFGI